MSRIPDISMFGDYSKDLLRSGIIEFKAGNRAAARRYLDRAVYMSSDREVMAEAWYWLSQAADDDTEKRAALENCLANDLQHSRARRALAILDGRLKPDEIIDLDAPVPPPSGEHVEARRFTCPKCGGRMVYLPDGRALICEYCSRHERLGPAPGPAAEKDFIVAMATRRGHSKPLREHVLHCQGCGAEFILAGGTLSFNCAYCDSAHVVSMERSRDLIAPDGIVPHAFDQRHAADALADCLDGLRVEPDRPVRPPRGLYLPIWTFQLAGAIGYAGEISTQPGSAYTDVPEKQEKVEGRHPVLMKVAVSASRRSSAPFVELLANFDLSSVQPYDARYLSTWPAELYDVPMADASLEARSQAYASLKRDLPDLLAPVRVLSTSSADLMIDTFRLDLVPVWLTEVFVAGRGGMMLMDGRSGATYGDTWRHQKRRGGALREWLREFLRE